MSVDDAAMAVRADRVTQLAAELIRCDTRNPPGGEGSVVAPLSTVLRELGADIEIVEPEPGRLSILARIGTGAGPVLLVNGHTDVVPVVEKDWSVPPFGGYICDGRLYGRGACDMKGGIAAAIEGMRACQDVGVVPPGTVVFHFVADEETGGRAGTRALVSAGLVRAHAAVIPEPTELNIVVAERGSLMVEIVVHGQAGHGSEPGNAHSAVADAARIATAVHCADLGVEHPLLGSPTCNVGTIHGGTAVNIVAAECRLRVDTRLLPGQTADQALQMLRSLIDAAGDYSYEISVLAFAEASELPAQHPFAAAVQQAGDGAPIRGSSLGTDARFLRNQLDIPTVVFGPGSMRHAHAADEHVPISDLIAASRTFARLYANFPGIGHSEAG